MGTRKKRVAEGQTKQKAKGFGLRLTAAILFLLIAIAMAASTVYNYSTNYCSTFTGWFDKAKKHEYINCYNIERLTTDKEYENVELIEVFSSYYGEKEKPIYATVRYYVLEETEEEYGEGEKLYYKDTYYLSSDNTEETTLTFVGEEGLRLSISYENWQNYKQFQEYNGWLHGGGYVIFPILAVCAAITALLAALQFAGAVAGRKHKWGNVLSMVIGTITFFTIIGMFALAGGVKGFGQQTKGKREEADDAPDERAEPEPAKEEPNGKTLANYPVDYENKPTVSQVLDYENSNNIVLQNEDGESAEFRQIYVGIYRDELYFVAETADLSEKEGGGTVLFRVDYEQDKLVMDNDEEIYNALYEQYQAAENDVQYEKKQITRSEFRLDLYDTTVDEKTWKDYKKSAPQDELAVIAIGAKYRVVHSRILNIICALGILLSVLLLFPTGGYSLIAYPVFAFLATKSIRYEDTYGQAYRKLSKENKAYVDGFYHSNIWLKVLDVIIKLPIFYLTIPYQALMLAIGLIAPNFVIAKNGVLVSLPKGFEAGNLSAVGKYYGSFSFNDFIDEALANTKSASPNKEEEESSPTDEYYRQDEYTYTDSHGYTQTIYTDKGGKEAYDVGGHYAGTVSGEGGEKKFKPAGTLKRDREEKDNSSKKDENDSE